MSQFMNQSIYIETLGSASPAATDMVMLHGWAMHGGLMRSLAEELTAQFRVHLVDLPGHGLSQAGNSDFSLKQLSEQIYMSISEKINGDAIWLGWSLGGMVALKIASQYPDKIKKLILLSSTPAFVKKVDWTYAVDSSVFDSFASDLLNDPEGTIKRFVSLQVRGSEDSRQILKQIREILFSKQLASNEALFKGLEILQTEDLRGVYESLSMPVQLLGGERDTLVPKTALDELHKIKPESELYIVKKAGHAPFLSHSNESARAILEFCHD